MSQQSTEKKSVPWLLMGLGLLIPIFIIGMAFLAAKSDAETKKNMINNMQKLQRNLKNRKMLNQQFSLNNP
jgi:uncharacterized membrane-anchored protein YhcB (DUF1043 family)